jgi:photosystem II cytochrome b559 subunit alpha
MLLQEVLYQILRQLSTGERPFIDIFQDRRYWVIHLITIPSLFLGGVILVLCGFGYKLFGVANNLAYLDKDHTQISLINDRFSILNELEDI